MPVIGSPHGEAGAYEPEGGSAWSADSRHVPRTGARGPVPSPLAGEVGRPRPGGGVAETDIRGQRPTRVQLVRGPPSGRRGDLLPREGGGGVISLAGELQLLQDRVDGLRRAQEQHL